jgi:Fic family protein
LGVPVILVAAALEAKRYIGELEGIGSVLPNPTILVRPLADREAIQSSKLEGTYATPKELLLFELQPSVAVSESDKTQDYREVYNYQQALSARSERVASAIASFDP